MTTMTEAAKVAKPPQANPLPLSRNWRFQALWGGSAMALLGTFTADVAYPLLLLAMTGSTVLAGAFGALQTGATVVAGLHAGSVVDRRDRRRVMIFADVFRTLFTASIPVAMALHHLTVVHVLLVAVAIGAATAYATPVRMLAIRAMVAPEQLTQALSQDEGRMVGASLMGPPLAGFLYGVGRSVPFVGTALGYLISTCTDFAVRFPETAEPTQSPKYEGVLAGFRVLISSAVLRATLGVILVLNVVGAAMQLSVIVLLRDHGSSSRTIGLALAGEAVGGLVGTFLTRRLHRLMRPGRLLLAVAWSGALLMVALLLPGGAATVFACFVLMSLGVPALRVMLDVLIFRQVPDEVKGRVVSATVTVLTLGLPFGMFGGGLLLGMVSPATALLILAGTLVAALVPATAARELRNAVWPMR